MRLCGMSRQNILIKICGGLTLALPRPMKNGKEETLDYIKTCIVKIKNNICMDGNKNV